MSDAPCDVGPVVHVPPLSVNPGEPLGRAVERYFDAPTPERDDRDRRRQAERDLMEFYINPADYIAACDAVKFPAAKPDPLVEHGETFARLIGR